MNAKMRLSADLEVDAIEYASRANAILGIRDSGKTYTGTMIAEQLFLAGIPFFAFDPIGRWRFLKSPGRGAGFPIVVAGGAAPDLPLTPENAPDLIRAAMRSGVSMVIDLYSIDLSKKDWRAIVRNSIDTILYEGDGHGQRHVFLEEAAEFIPQKPYDMLTYSTVEKLARMGGNVGVGLTLINQRAEEVNKAVLELCDNLLLHRQRGKNSLLSLRKWLAAGNVSPPKEITDTLADMPTGECWAWFKDIGRPVHIKVAEKRSFNPDRRAMALNKGKALKAAPASVDVSEFVARMKAALAGKPVPTLPPPALPKPPAKTAAPVRQLAPAAPAAPKPAPKEPEVKESEARALRAENEELRRDVESLRAKVNDNRVEPASGASLDIDSIWDEIKRRAAKDPAVIRILTQRPEIEVSIKRNVIEIDGTSAKGRICQLLANGFFDQGATNGGTRTELKRTGADVNNGSIHKILYALVADGFLTNEISRFVAVEGMKVNLVER